MDLAYVPVFQTFVRRYTSPRLIFATAVICLFVFFIVIVFIYLLIPLFQVKHFFCVCVPQGRHCDIKHHLILSGFKSENDDTIIMLETFCGIKLINTAMDYLGKVGIL